MNPLLVVWAALMGLFAWVLSSALLSLLSISAQSPLGYAVHFAVLALGLFLVFRFVGRRKG